MSRRQSLALLFTANGISGFAQGITMLSVPWYFARQGISSDFNLIYGIITGATVLWGLTAGTIVDRFNRKKVFLINNAVEGAILLSAAAYGLITGDMPTLLIILVFTTTVFGFYLHYPNLYAFAHEITKEGEYTKVTSAIEIVGQSTNVLAGAGAALLLEGINIAYAWNVGGRSIAINWQVDPWTIQEIFLMDGITYGLSIVLIALIRYVPAHLDTIDRGAFVQRLRTGFSYLRRNPTIFLFGVFSHSIFVVMLVKLNALMPLYITNHLRAGGNVFGAMEVLYGLGALTAGALVGALFRNFTAVRAIIIMLLLATAALTLSTLTRSVGVFLCVGLMIGFANAGARVLRLSFLFRHVPNQVIGRVNSIFGIINVMNRTAFILILSFPFFGVGSHILWGYGLMALFTLMSAAVLTVRYRSIVTVG
ncbi:MAG: MFS transporter [Tunicatimonas sp.]